MIKRFREISMKDINTCGGKGASLGEMMKEGFPIPNGFVVTTEAFGQDPHVWSGYVGDAFDILNTKFVAVRSSGTKEDGIVDSFAGQFDTHLFVDRESLIEKIKECQESINSERLIAYCHSKNIDRSQIKVAVVVQKMVNSESAGVCFTINPVSNNNHEIMIEAGRGIGEAVVSGMITPDNYIIHKKSGEINKNISSQTKKIIIDQEKGGTKEIEVEKNLVYEQKLTDEKIQELTSLAKKVEKHYQKSMDIERATEGDSLFLLQARPVTTNDEETKTQERREHVISRNFPPLARTAGAYYEFRGLHIGPLFWKREREMQIKYKVQQSYMIQDPAAYYTSNISKVIEDIQPDFENALDTYNKEIYETVRLKEGSNLNDIYMLNERHNLVYGLMCAALDIAGDIKNRIDELIPIQDESFIHYLTTPREPTAIQREQQSLYSLQERYKSEVLPENSISQLAEDFGYLHQDYLGIAWKDEDYKKVLSDNTSSLTIPEYESYTLNEGGDYERWLINIFKKVIYMYEEGRNAMIRCVRAIRKILKNLGINDEIVLYMTTEEVSSYALGIGSIIDRETLEKRKEAFALYFENGSYREYSGEHEVESLIHEQKIEHFWIQKEIQSNGLLKGSVGFKGCVTGKVRLVFSQEDSHLVQEGDILVSPMTQVEFLAGIRKCGGIITDEGGIISHAAIVSRELGKPCILGTQHATKLLKNGDIIELDANRGVVRIIK